MPLGMLPLSGIRVADFTWAWAGAYGAELLGALGAQVIKIENHKRIDGTRKYSNVTYWTPLTGVEESLQYQEFNRDKLDITLDLSSRDGVELAKRLILVSDVVAENFRPGVMSKLGFDYAVVRKLRPDVVMVSTSAVGQTGPERLAAGVAVCFAAAGGLSSLTGYPDRPPSEVRGPSDLRAGNTWVYALLAALVHRQRTGEGQYVDVSATEALSALVGDAIVDSAMNGHAPTRTTNSDVRWAPHGCYRCRGDDAWVTIVVATEEEWKAFCGAVGHADWLESERFADAPRRKRHEQELDALVEEWTRQRTPYEVMEVLQRVGVAASPTFTCRDLCTDAHISARESFQDVHHPVIGTGKALATPWIFDGERLKFRRHGPLLGEHNTQVLAELLGVTTHAIEQYRAAGAIGP